MLRSRQKTKGNVVNQEAVAADIKNLIIIFSKNENHEYSNKNNK